MNAYVHKTDYYYLLNRVEDMKDAMYRMGSDLQSYMKSSQDMANMLKTIVQELKDVKRKNTELTQKVEALTKEIESYQERQETRSEF
jgi:gas vesicle protein